MPRVVTIVALSRTELLMTMENTLLKIASLAPTAPGKGTLYEPNQQYACKA